MRRTDKTLGDPDAIAAFLQTAPVGRLATIGDDGYPMIKPVNFVFADSVIFFHSAKAGEKIDHLRRDDRVCFEVDLPIAYVRPREEGCRASYLFRSVVIKGRARFVEEAGEKLRVLRLLLQKHQGPGTYEMAPDHVEATAVVRIDIETMTGKEGLGKGRVKDEAERALASGGPLPVVIEQE